MTEFDVQAALQIIDNLIWVSSWWFVVVFGIAAIIAGATDFFKK
jgi:hypothetical protein